MRLSSCRTGLCQNAGTCVDARNSAGYQCQCAEGYTGQLCEININECASNPCFNGGTCFDRLSSYECYCPLGFIGLRCEVETNDCASSPCLMGQCVTSKPFGYSCVCPAGRTGVNCEIRINECASNPCQNGGLCTQIEPYGFQCTCIPGYQGMYCEIPINICDSSPCLNGATCIQSNITSYFCQCQCGFTGTRCESTVNECVNNPCLNGGTCTKPKACGFICACPQEPVAYYGAICENSIYVKASNPNYVYSSKETLYFSGSGLAKMRFDDIKANIYTAYNMENINNLCPGKFTLIGSACYRIIYDASYDWNQAKSQCMALQSSLAWFDSAQDLDTVRVWLNKEYIYLTNDVWVGGKSLYSSRSPWFWDFNSTQISSSVLNANWAPGEPNQEQQRTALLLRKANGYLFANEAPEKRLYSILCKKKSFFFDAANTNVRLENQVNAVDSFGSPLLGYSFLTNVSHESDFTSVVPPSPGTYMSIFQRIPIKYGSLFTGKAYPYSAPFTVAICNDLTASQIQLVRQNIKSTWMSVRQEFAQCNCFEVYIVSTDKFTDTNNVITTQLTYVPRANQLVIERTSSGPIPSSGQVYQSLQANGFTQCQSRTKRSALLDVNVVSSSSQLAPSDYQRLKETVQKSLRAVRPDYATNHKLIDAKIVSNADALDIHSKLPVSQVYLEVTVNGVPVNFYTQTDFDKERLVDELNYQNENSSLTILKSHEIYSKNYFFNMVSNVPVHKLDYPVIEHAIQTRFLAKYASFVTKNVTTSIIWQEEYLNADRAIVHGLSVLISIDKKPVDQLIELDRSIFKSLKSVPVKKDLTYHLYLPDDVAYLHPLSKALAFYSNILVCRRDYHKFEKLIQSVLMEYKQGLVGKDITVVLADQNQFVDTMGRPHWKVLVLTTFTRNNKLVDLRLDSKAIVDNMKAKLNFESSNGEAYRLEADMPALLDMKRHFSVYIEGRIHPKLNKDIQRAIELTWNLTAYQTRNFEQYFLKNYKFTFVPLNQIEVDTEGKIQTKVVYFISSGGKLATKADFSLVPKLNWIQDTFNKYSLPYTLLDGTDESIKPYNKLYKVDFSGYVDPSDEDRIRHIIFKAFKTSYRGKFNQ